MSLLNLKKPSSVYVSKQDHSSLINGAGFKVFDDAETVLAISVPGCSEYSRKQTDELTEWVKRPQLGMKGLVYIKMNADGSIKSSVDKFFNEEKLKQIAAQCNAQTGDLILIVAGEKNLTRKAISELRLEMAQRAGLRNPEIFAPLWVTDFPLFDYDAEDKDAKTLKLLKDHPCKRILLLTGTPV